MRSLLVYSSKTGNTRKLAEAIGEIMPAGADFYPIEEAPLPDSYDFIVLGFWVDRGTADQKTLAYIEKIEDKAVAFFATLGAYPDSEHAKNVVERVTGLLGAKNRVLDHFICQGKIDPGLTEKFKELPPEHPHAMTPERMARHQEASKHPNQQDLQQAREIFQRVIMEYC